MTEKKATISDVAALAKVGKTSVSRYLNGEYQVLSEDMRSRIAKAIAELNYKPSRLARGMKKGQTKLIALVFADLNISYALEIMQGVEKACREYDYTLLVFNADNDSEQEKRILQLLASYQVEGVIIQALRTHDQNFAGFSLPIVSVDRVIHGLQTDLVQLDNFQATQLAIAHLHKNEFQRILFLTEPIEDIQPRLQRVQAFHKYLADYPECLGEVVELRDSRDENETDKAISDFYAAHPTAKKAVFAVNGVVMLNSALALKRLNIQMGSEIGFIGFDDPNWAAVLGTGITAIRQPTQDIGYTAFELLLKRIQGDRSGLKTILYPAQLMIRESTQTGES